MERFDVRKDATTDFGWKPVPREDGRGMFCWAEEGLQYQRQYRMALVINIIVVAICAALAGYLVYHKHDPQGGPVQRTGVSTEQYEQAVQEQQQLQARLTSAQRKIADLTTKSNQLAKMIKTQNVVLQQREQQLKALQVSVPPQPIILEAVRREAVTQAGFRKVVERNFGNEIARGLSFRE